MTIGTKNIFNFYKKLSVAGKTGIWMMLLLMMIGIFADWLCIYSHNVPSGKALQSPNVQHWLGTDDLGIDLWAQICHGARLSMLVGISTALVAGVGGSLVGMIAGYFGGFFDRMVMRITDVMIIIPELPMMIVLGAFFGASIYNIIIVLALFSWTDSARIVRSKILSMRQEQYIRVACSYGAGFFHLMRYHFIPGILPLITISMIRLTGRGIVAEAGLSFLGLGDPTSKSWGLILHHAIQFKGIYFTEFWKWWITMPLVSITLLVGIIAILARDCEKLVNTK